MEKGKKLTRRELLRSAGVAGAALLAAPMVNRGRFALFAGSTAEYSTRAIDLVKESTVIDMLCVMTLDFAKQDRWMKNPELFTEKDLEPFKESGINVIHPAIGMGGFNSYDSVTRFFALWNGFIASHSDKLARVDSPDDFDRVKKSGKLGIL
ncbi:MAG TPA: hypothetical protein VFZ49_05910, partial [Pyrinomonadaceae bacterium]